MGSRRVYRELERRLARGDDPDCGCPHGVFHKLLVYEFNELRDVRWLAALQTTRFAGIHAPVKESLTAALDITSRQWDAAAGTIPGMKAGGSQKTSGNAPAPGSRDDVVAQFEKLREELMNNPDHPLHSIETPIPVDDAPKRENFSWLPPQEQRRKRRL